MYNKTDNRIRKIGSRLAVFSFLLVYLVAFIQFNIVHHWHHHDHAHELHSEEQEQDLCHLAQYHQGQSCGHNSHISAKVQSCELCDIIITSQKKVEIEAISIVLATPQFLLPTGQVWSIKACFSYHYRLRGPPSIA